VKAGARVLFQGFDAAGLIWLCELDADMNAFKTLFITLLCLFAGSFSAQSQTPEGKSSGSEKAVAVLHPSSGSKVTGTVTLSKQAEGVQIQAEITGLSPGNHGFHIHEFGDCTATDASSAGAHFNPTHKPHAGPDTPERHVGDMGNVQADASGKATLKYVDHQISLTDDERSVIGRSVVVHEKADDLKSQPSGDSGARIACGVIGRAKGH
jgi:Cu-Zn family superoxide dismutase